jgi:hypothetical protein
MKMKSNCQAKGKALFLGLALLLMLTACGKSVKALKDAGDVQGLISILGDADEEGSTRKDAALALGEIGDPAAVESLVRYMQECAETLDAHSSNDEWQACFDAIGPVSEILGWMGDARAVEPLIDMLEDHWVHEEAVRALGMLKDPRAILPLIETIDHGTSQFTEISERYGIHKDVILALAPNAPPEIFDALRDALPGFRAQEAERCMKYQLALDALDAMQDPRIETLFLSLLKTYDMDCDAGIPDRLAELWHFDTAKLLPFIKLGNGYSYQSDFAQIFFSQTPTPRPIEVDYVSIYEYLSHTQVVITGLLSVGPVVSCDPDCNVLLENPLNSSEKVSVLFHLQSQMDGLRNPYEKEDLRVYMDNGDVAGYHSLVRITGTICEGYRGSICDVNKIEPAK